MTLTRRAVVASLPGMAASAARAQSNDNRQDRPVTFIVPFAPGGGTDTLARLLAQKLELRLGAPFTVEVRPGGGTVIATNLVAKSPPDGNTLMMAVSSLAIDVTLYKKLPYDPVKDVALVGLIASVPFVLVVSASLPVGSVDDLIKLARQKPLSYGSGGIGSFHHLAGALFAKMADVTMTHVPYRGSTPALNELVAGYIQVLFSDLGPALPLIKAGKVRALAVTTSQRLPSLPDIPPLDESGLPGFDAAAWQGVIARADTPRTILEGLNSELNAIVAMEDVRARLADLGMNPIGQGSLEELHEFLEADIARWARLVEEAGLAKSE